MPENRSDSGRLVLSLFSGVGALDEGFRRAGFCVVSAGDVAWSSLYDVRGFHPPAGLFEGVIGGDPCQSHSALANLVRAKGLEPSFPDMGPELQRVIEEARARWFLRENVPNAPDIKPAGYDVRSFLLDHSTLDSGDGTGHEQMRKRRFWFGVRDGMAPELRAQIAFAIDVLPDRDGAVGNGHDYIDGAEPIGRYRRTATDTSDGGGPRSRRQTVSGRHTSDGMGGTPGITPGNNAGNPPRYSLDEMLDLQGLPRDVFEHSPLTVQGKRKLVGNAVPLPMAEALARAVAKAMNDRAEVAA